MQAPDTPADESERLNVLRSLAVLDTAPEERFDRLTRIAQQIFQVPIALVSLVDAERQWFKSRQGLLATETPRDISFCGHAILRDEIFVVPNTQKDPRFADNPLVTGAPDIRFYAGAPLATASGRRIGTLCVIDRAARDLSTEQRQILRDLADCVVAELERTQLMRAAALLRDTFENMAQGISLVDGDLRMVGWNHRMLELLDLPPSLFHGGATFEDVMRFNAQRGEYGPGDVEELVRQRVERARNMAPHCFERVRPDGTILEIRGSPLASGGFATTYTDITERKRAEQDLKSSENRIRAIVETVVDGIISIDARGSIQTANHAAEKIFGYSRDEMVGHNVKLLMPDPDHSAHDGYLNNYLTTGKRKVIGIGREVTGRRKDGSTFPMELAVSEMNVNGARMFTGIVRDITERKKVERLKSEFVSTVSHELRTPLTSIRGALGLVLGKASAGLSEKARTLLETANRNSERLTLLINDILDLEKMESGRLEFEFKPIDLVAVTRQAVAANEGYAEQHHVRLRVTVSPASAAILGDEHRLLQVFANLISNAVKYSPPDGEVEIGVHTQEASFRVSVKDHGRGIPQAFRSRMFQRFAQADSSDTREKGGTGLGLSITKGIVESHDGSIGYVTEEGVGTEFFFEIPEWREVTSKSHAGDSRPIVLICEDNPDVAAVLAELLAEEGLASDIAATATAAKRQLTLKPYRALLLDLSLPDTDGTALIDELRGQEATVHLPIIVVSGRATEGRSAWTGDALTVVDWLQKPVDRNRLARALQQVLTSHARPRILHVEDDRDVVQIIQTLVEDIGHYTYAGTLADARTMLATQHFDLLLLDLGLPDGQGIELLDVIESRIPVVVFSGEQADAALSQRVNAALTKSRTSNDQFLAALRQVMNPQQRGV